MTIDDNGGGHVGFQCVEKLGKGCLSEADMATLVTMLTKLLQNHFDRQAQRQGECLGKTVGGEGGVSGGESVSMNAVSGNRSPPLSLW